ncbi:MAG: hypothetical protein WCA29_13690 [Jiangellales bacterium]
MAADAVGVIDHRIRVVVAVHTLEVRAALFVALSGESLVEIVGSGATSAELATFSRSLQPDVAVVEAGLSHLTASQLAGSTGLPSSRVLVVPNPRWPQDDAFPVVLETDDLAQLIVRHAQ